MSIIEYRVLRNNRPPTFTSTKWREMNIFKIIELQNILYKILNKEELNALEYETIEPTKNRIHLPN